MPTPFTNQAQLNYNNTVLNSNVAYGEIVEVLSATKTAVSRDYAQGETAAYVITINNSGTSAYNGLTVTDNLGGYDFNGTTLYPLEYIPGTVKFFLNGVLQASPQEVAGPPLAFSGISVPAGQTATLVFDTRATEYAPLATGSTINNTVTVSGTGLTPVTATAALPVSATPELSINKSVSPVSVPENGTLTYTFLIQNAGNTPLLASENATISDTFTPILENLTVTFNGNTWTEGTNYSYSNTTGLFTSLAGQIQVPAATYTQDATTGVWGVTPGVSTLVVSGTV